MHREQDVADTFRFVPAVDAERATLRASVASLLFVDACNAILDGAAPHADPFELLGELSLGEGRDRWSEQLDFVTTHAQACTAISDIGGFVELVHRDHSTLAVRFARRADGELSTMLLAALPTEERRVDDQDVEYLQPLHASDLSSPPSTWERLAAPSRTTAPSGAAPGPRDARIVTVGSAIDRSSTGSAFESIGPDAPWGHASSPSDPSTQDEPAIVWQADDSTPLEETSPPASTDAAHGEAEEPVRSTRDVASDPGGESTGLEHQGSATVPSPPPAPAELPEPTDERLFAIRLVDAGMSNERTAELLTHLLVVDRAAAEALAHDTPSALDGTWSARDVRRIDTVLRYGSHARIEFEAQGPDEAPENKPPS